MLQAELAAHRHQLLQAPALVVATKTDALQDPAAALARLKAATPLPIVPVSSHARSGLERLKGALRQLAGVAVETLHDDDDPEASV